MSPRRAVLAVLTTALLGLAMMALPSLAGAAAPPCTVQATLLDGQLEPAYTVPAGTPPSALKVPAGGKVVMTCATPQAITRVTIVTSGASTVTTTTTTPVQTGTQSSPTTSTTTTTTTTTSPSTTTSTSTSSPAPPRPPKPSKPIRHRTRPTRPKATRHRARPRHVHHAAPKRKPSHHATHHGATHHGATRHHTTSANPGYSLSLPRPAPVGVPNFFLDSFQIPPFLIPIYQAAGIQYQVPWQVLAAINEIETDYGRNLSTSSAGAVGWMQFLPSTWKTWGIDANGDGVADPYNPVDAIFAAARYLHAAGAGQDISRAIFAYNHAGWYVQSVLLRAKLIGGIPTPVVSALGGMVQGHFPVAARAQYGDDSVVSLARHRVRGSNAAVTISSDPGSHGTSIFARRGSPVVAVNDGRIVKLGSSPSLGRYVELQDSTGNVFTYAHLGSVSTKYPVPKPIEAPSAGQGSGSATSAGSAASPSTPASAGQQQTPAAASGSVPTTRSSKARSSKARSSKASRPSAPASTPMLKERLFAHPSRPASYAAGGKQQLGRTAPQISSFDNYFADALHLGRNQYTLAPLRVGSIVIAGTILGRIGGPSQGLTPHVYFTIQPAGKGAPQIDPKPILDGWKLLAATDVYRGGGSATYFGPGAKNPSVGQILLMSKQQLTQRVLRDPSVQIYSCGRRDIETGQLDRRVLATIEFLSASGMRPDVTGLKCGAGTSSGVDPQGRTGLSVDISKISGVPVAGHQGSGSVTDLAIRRLLTLQGSMRPDQIISDIAYKGQSNTVALPDHRDRIQITFAADYGDNARASAQIKSILAPAQWAQLISRISQIPEPVVPIAPSRYAIRQR